MNLKIKVSSFISFLQKVYKNSFLGSIESGKIKDYEIEFILKTPELCQTFLSMTIFKMPVFSSIERKSFYLKKFSMKPKFYCLLFIL